MIPNMVLDFEYVYVAIWYKCILFLVLKAALGWSDAIFWTNQTVLIVLIPVFYPLSDCINSTVDYLSNIMLFETFVKKQ